jgi:hypothetical protein
MQKWISFGVLAVSLLGCAPSASSETQAPRGRTLYATTQDNRLAMFGSQNPSSSFSAMPFAGLGTNEVMVGLDFGPRDGKLYGVSNQNRIYTIDPSSATVSPIGTSAFAPGLVGGFFGMDFNPTVNRIRIHGNTGFNARLNQETGAMVDFDTNTAGTQPDLNLSYTATDAGNGTAPSVAAAAYTNSNATATTTILYAIDSSRDVLVTVAPPNDGKLNTVGALGVDTSAVAGFDISGAADGTAFAALTVGGVGSLYTINLATGQATVVGGLAAPVTGLAIAP